MKKTKLLLVLLASALGFIACSDDNDLQTSAETDANTNVSITLSLPQNLSLRALPSDYNDVGEWAGKDKIEKVAIFLVDGSTVTTAAYTVGTTVDDGYTQEVSNTSNQVVLKPKKAIKTSAGIKKVYVLINGNSDIEAALAATPANTFEDTYKTAALNLVNSGTSLTVSTSADKLAAKNGTADETIVMTNVQEVSINVAPNVSAEDALRDANPLNRASVQVERAVARVMVTTAAPTYEIKSGADLLGTISNITWVLAQGENSVYIQRKSDYVTPNYGWIPTTNAEYFGNAGNKYDYSGLFEEYNGSALFGGTPVPTMADYAAASAQTQITDGLSAK